MPASPTGRGGSAGIVLPFVDDSATAYSAYAYNGLDPDNIPGGGDGRVFVFFPWFDGNTGYAVFFGGDQFPYYGGNGGPTQGGGIGLVPNAYRGVSQVDLYPGPGAGYVTTQHVDSSGILGVNQGAVVASGVVGKVAFSVVVDEYFSPEYLDPTEAVYFPDPDDPNSLPFPITGGNAMPDSIPARKGQLFVSPRVGQTVVVTATVNGASCSGSFVWRPGMAFYHGFAHRLEVVSGGGYAAYAQAAPNVQNVDLYEQADHVDTVDGAVYTARGLVRVAYASPNPGRGAAAMDAQAEIPTHYRFDASLVGSDGRPWASPLTVSYPDGSHPVTGSDTWEVRQRSWGITEYRGVDLPSLSTVGSAGVSDEKVWMMAALGQSSLASSHLDRRDWRLRFKTFRFGSLSIACAPTRAVSAASTPTLTFSEDLWGGYRYLERMVTAPTGRKVSVSVAGGNVAKTFEATKTADGTEWVRFDLCSPSNALSGDGAWRRDSRYPLRPMPTHADSPVNAEPDDDLGYLDGIVEPPGGDADESHQTWFMGVYDVASAAFSVASEGGDDPVVWGATRLVRVSAPKVTLAEGFCGQGKVLQDGSDCLKLWPLSASGGRTSETGAVWGAPFAHAHVDGKAVYDLPAIGYRQFAAGGYEWTFDSVATLAANLSHYAGWSASVTGGSNFYGLGAGSWASLLGGEGSDFSGAAWTHWVDRPLGSIPIQDQFDWVRAWPGCGDCWQWGVGDLGDPCVLAVGKILGVRSQGFVFRGDDDPETGKPLVGAPVRNLRVDQGSGASVEATIGEGSSQADGSYSTSVLAGPVGSSPPGTAYDGLEGGDETVSTTLQSSPSPSESSRFRSRWIKRTSFRGSAPPGGRAFGIDVSRAGRWARAFGKGGTLWIGRAANYALPSVWADVDTGLPADWARVRYPRVGQADPLFALVGKDSAIELYRIDAEGSAPIMSHTIGAGQAGELLALDDGPLLAWRVQGGAVYLRRFRRDETEIGTEKATNLTGLDDGAGVAAGFYPDPRDGKRRIGLLHVVGGTLVLRLSDDGVTFD